jgi:cytochrome c oxidase cbb3-type subunit 3
MSSFWSNWIIILTSITIIGITWLLFANRKKDKDAGETTGHVYDGIEEYDNPLPAWWFFMFTITIVWGLGYLAAYPGMGNYKGFLDWTQEGQHDHEVAKAEAKYRAMRDRYLALPLEEIAKDPAVLKMGQRLFGNNCAQCHGADARGGYGFPNLTDNDWLWGGTPAAIKHTLINGRQAAMPAWGSVLGDQGIKEMTAHLLTLNKRTADSQLAAAGAQKFGMYCAACHMPDGTGNQMMGAPNLTDGIWLYGGSEADIAQTLRAGRNGIMPAQARSLSEDRIHILTAYVYSLSNKEG